MLDLVAVERGSLPTVRHEPGSDDGLTITDGGHAGLHLDERAREAYRRRLVDIDEDIDDATMMNDAARLALAMEDRDYLIAELSRAVGLGGRARLACATAERARTSVDALDALRSGAPRRTPSGAGPAPHPGARHRYVLRVPARSPCPRRLDRVTAPTPVLR